MPPNGFLVLGGGFGGELSKFSTFRDFSRFRHFSCFREIIENFDFSDFSRFRVFAVLALFVFSRCRGFCGFWVMRYIVTWHVFGL